MQITMQLACQPCRRLVASGCLPDRAGQPTQIQLNMTLDQLAGGASGWSGPGPAAGPGDDCDASIAPIVTGHVDPEILDRLAAMLLRPQPASPGPAGQLGLAYARDLVLRDAIALLSGPAGLAAWLRTSQHAGPAASISLPLDVGTATDTIPAHLRRAVITRDKHCAFPCGCSQPPAASQSAGRAASPLPVRPLARPNRSARSVGARHGPKLARFAGSASSKGFS